jgi:glycosyltransferase involved in cell wall biosynthesis
MGAFDCVLLNRPEVADGYLETLRAERLPILYYGHDLHFARMAMEATRTGDPMQMHRSQEMQRLERAIWRQVDVATYPSHEEIDEVRRLEPQVIARQLQPFCFDDFRERTAPPTGRGIMFVGSFRHSPNLAAAELLAREVYPLVRGTVPEARLVIAGAFPPETIKACSGNGIDVVGWLGDQELARLYETSRVVAVPLLVGAGVKLKVVEALSHGVPLVTTSVGAQGLLGLDALVPVRDQIEGFARAIVDTLRLDDEAWLRQSRAQLRYARDHFSREAMKRSLTEALELLRRP